MHHPLLDEDWSEYEIRKFIERKDKTKFECDDKRDVKFLADKLQNHFPEKTIAAIESVIQICCAEQKVVTSKESFVTKVIIKLKPPE